MNHRYFLMIITILNYHQHFALYYNSKQVINYHQCVYIRKEKETKRSLNKQIEFRLSTPCLEISKHVKQIVLSIRTRTSKNSNSSVCEFIFLFFEYKNMFHVRLTKVRKKRECWVLSLISILFIQTEYLHSILNKFVCSAEVRLKVKDQTRPIATKTVYTFLIL